LPRLPTRSLAVIAFAGLLGLGALVRIVALTEPPLDAAVGRQFHSAFLARVISLELMPNADPSRLALARAGAPELIEPPILEAVTGAAFAVLGEEALWVPRLLSIVAWIIGAALLAAIARSVGLGPGALAAAAVFLFLPFAIQYSRTFQPEPTMVAAMLGAILAMLHHDERPTWRRALLIATLASLAIFIKLVAAFVLAAVFVALAVRRGGLRQLVAPQSLLIGVVALLPGIAWTMYGIFGAGFLAGQEDGRIEPQLLVTTFFWGGWARWLIRLVTVPVLLAAAAGLLLAPRGRARTLLVGWSVGYAAFALTFSYHAATHDYYHLQVVPLVALAVGAAVTWAVRRDSRLGWAVGAIVAVGVLTGAALGLGRTLPRAEHARFVQIARAVGAATGHPVRSVLVTTRPYPPRHLWFYGELVGRAWALDGPAGESRPLTLAQATKALDEFIASGQEQLVITNPSLVDAVPGLWELLRSRYPVQTDGDGFVIFALQGR
jgi:hypothetical protein